MVVTIRNRVRRLAHRLGVDVRRYPQGLTGEARSRLLHALEVEVILDVGANEGQYALELREFGFAGVIHSFEPSSAAFASLLVNSRADSLWSVHRMALGSKAGQATLNIAGNSTSSSLRPMHELHIAAAPESRYIRIEKVRVDTLSSVGPVLTAGARRTLLKIDAQGAERDVLEGGADWLAQVTLVQLEVSMAPLYADGLQLADALEWAEDAERTLVRIEPGFTHRRDGRTLQFDGFFLQNRSLGSLK